MKKLSPNNYVKLINKLRNDPVSVKKTIGTVISIQGEDDAVIEGLNGETVYFSWKNSNEEGLTDEIALCDLNEKDIERLCDILCNK